MNSRNEASSLDFLDLCSLVWRQKWVVVLLVAACTSAGLIYVGVATPEYRSEVLLAPNQTSQRPGVPGGVAGLSTLANVAGLNIAAPRDAVQSIATLESRVFLEGFIQEYDLLPKLFSSEWDSTKEEWQGDQMEWPTLADGVAFFAGEIREVKEDPETGLVTLSIEWTDPDMAADWANKLVVRVNEVLQSRDLANSERRLEYLSGALQDASLVGLRQAITNVIQEQIQTRMLAQSEDEYAFRVIDPARVATRPFSPNKLRIVVASACLGLLLGMFWSLLRFAIARHRTRLADSE